VDLDNLFKDVASVLVDKTINPVTQRPYTLTLLERALRDVHFNVDPKKSAKQQALEVRLGGGWGAAGGRCLPAGR
jgi:ribosome maturation protein SDO1